MNTEVTSTKLFEIVIKQEAQTVIALAVILIK